MDKEKPESSRYNNMKAIENAAEYPPIWANRAEKFRVGYAKKELDLSYGSKPRNVMDLFFTEGASNGTVIFVHGGFWQRMDKSYFSHLSQGILKRGWDVVQTSYTLAPEARIHEITQEIGAAIECISGKTKGPIIMVGHSAGGHLVSRMISETTPLPSAVLRRITHVMSVSGLHELIDFIDSDEHPATRMSVSEAKRESPALLKRGHDAPLSIYVGGEELPAFIWQSKLMADCWTNTNLTVEIGSNHFTVLDGLCLPNSMICKKLLDGHS